MLFGALSSLLDSLVGPAPTGCRGAAVGSTPGPGEVDGDGPGCTCSKSVAMLRALHIEGLPLTMTAARLSELMSAYGAVQYAEAAPEVAKDEAGQISGRRLHCYAVFADHAGACTAKRALQPAPPAGPQLSRFASASAPPSMDGSALFAAAAAAAAGLQQAGEPALMAAAPRTSAIGDDSMQLVGQLQAQVQAHAAAAAAAAAQQQQQQEQPEQLAASADPADAAAAAAGSPAPPLASGLRVRFAKPQNVAAACTPAFRTFVAAQWAQAAAVAKACPELPKKLGCRVNALFIAKLHQHITSARLQSVFGKFGRMIACEVQYHSDGRSAGHGVVIYETIEDAERALTTVNGTRLEGRAVEVTPLRLKKLPSKLEHLKGRIKRLPAGGGGGGCGSGGAEDGGSEDGSGTPAGSFPGPGAAAALQHYAALAPRLSAGTPSPLGGAASDLSAAMAAAAAGAAAAAAAAAAGQRGAQQANALSALAAFGMGPPNGGGGGPLAHAGAMGRQQQQQQQQQQVMAAVAAAAAHAHQQHHMQQAAAAAAAQGMHPADAAALFHQAAAAAAAAAPNGAAANGAAANGAAAAHHQSAALLQAQAAFLQEHIAAQRAAAATAGLTPQQMAALTASLGIAGGGAAPGHGVPRPGGPAGLPGVPQSGIMPPRGLDLSFL